MRSKVHTRPRPKESHHEPSSAPGVNAANGEVMTLAEAAAYLRVAEQELLRLVGQADLPGRLIGSEWRFLKDALQDWLRTPARTASNVGLSALAGAWKDDPDLQDIVREACRKRGRPVAEEG
jgi:excisionase family DNA binding protein